MAGSRVLTGAAVAVAAGTVVAFFIAGPGLRVQGLLAPDDAEVVRQGAAVYRAHCADCHGPNLEGQDNWRERGPDGLLPAPPHDASGHTWHHSSAQLIEMTRFGPQLYAGADYRSAMPAYDQTLSRAEIVAVLSYIKSTWPTEIRQRHDRIDAQSAGN